MHVFARRVSILVLHDGEGRVFLQRRSASAKRAPNYWGFFGGGIDEGETPEGALARELQEELEYRVAHPRLILTQEYEWEGEWYQAYTFVEAYDASQTLVQHEGQGAGWFRPDETKDLLMLEHDRLSLAEAQRFF